MKEGDKMKIDIKKSGILKYESDMNNKYLGKTICKEISIDDMAWQWDITDEFERRFVKYSKENINSRLFLQHSAKLIDNSIHLFLFDVIDNKRVLSININCLEESGSLKILEVKVMQTNPDWRVENVED